MLWAFLVSHLNLRQTLAATITIQQNKKSLSDKETLKCWPFSKRLKLTSTESRSHNLFLLYEEELTLDTRVLKLTGSTVVS